MTTGHDVFRVMLAEGLQLDELKADKSRRTVSLPARPSTRSGRTECGRTTNPARPHAAGGTAAWCSPRRSIRR
jgi:hypothetical protein